MQRADNNFSKIKKEMRNCINLNINFILFIKNFSNRFDFLNLLNYRKVKKKSQKIKVG